MSPAKDDPSLEQTRLHQPAKDGAQVSPSEGAFSVFSETQKTVISKRGQKPNSTLPQMVNPHEVAKLLEGESLDHFSLKEFVGGGGMGAVFRAVDTELGRTVAVKVLSRNDTDDELRLRFRNEAQSAALLDHPHIARVLHVGEDQGWHFIVFEYIEGVNIRDLVEHKGPLPLDEALIFTRHVAEALQHASEREVVHRDIKPSNVLVTADGNAKLVDLGLARQHQIESSGADLTASGVTLGTFDYISPEQARDPRGTDVRSDLYSLGCTLFYMLTGSPPFPEGTVLQKLLSHSSEPPPDARIFRPELDERVVAVVEKLLAKQPADRFQSPADLVRELIILGEQLGVHKITEGKSLYLPIKTERVSFVERHIGWMLPLVLLVVAAVVVERTSKATVPHRLQPPRMDTPYARAANASPPAAKKKTADKKLDTTSGAPFKKKKEKKQPPAVAQQAPPGDEKKAAAAAPRPAGSTPVDGIAEATGPPLVDGEPTAIREDVLVVGGGGVTVPGEYQVEPTLVAALKRAQAATEITAIEIWSNEVIQLTAISLDMTARLGTPLTIRGGPGFRPLLSWRISPADLGTNRVHASRWLGGAVEWENVHFYWQIPQRERQTWSLFYLERVERWLMRRCTLTIRNVAEDGFSTGTDRVAFFRMAPPKMMDAARQGESTDDKGMMPITSLTLEDCVVRGQATLVRAEQAVPMGIEWRNGLFVSTERLIEFHGRRAKPKFEEGSLRLSLTHVTVAARKGIALLDSDDNFPHQLNFSSRCQSCIFVVDDSVPLYEQRSMSQQGMTNRPNLRGAYNYYQNTDIVLRSDLGTANETAEFSFMDLKDRQQKGDEEVRWYDEREFNSGRMLQWQPNAVPPTQSSVDLQQPEHYLLKKYDRDAAAGQAGFVPWQLPKAPAIRVSGISGEPRPSPKPSAPTRSEDEG